MKERRFGLVAAVVLASTACGLSAQAPAETSFEEFCLDGEFDLAARLQGRGPSPGEWYPSTWCVVSTSDSERVRFSAAGHSNPDMEGEFTVSYLAPDRVRLVNADAPPDVEFRGTLAADEARSLRRIDPRRLLEELDRHPEWVVAERPGGWRDVRWPGAEALASIEVREGRLETVRTTADLPLRGRVPVVWRWTWQAGDSGPGLEFTVDGRPLFRAAGTRREISPDEAERLWEPSGGESPIEVPGQAWPSVVNMRVETLGPGVRIVRGVRTGFHHLVVETRDGLVVADAPAGWVELHQVPPTDLVPGLGISGLSERFIDYLRRQWPGVPIRAVALTHVHDDHAGGARAFAAAGAEVYAPAEVADFLETALNRESMPTDRLSGMDRPVRVIGVDGRVVLPDPERSVELISMGANPHVDAALGVHVPSASVFFQSDLHVPTTETSTPRADRLETDCWFAGWATESLPPETELHNSHTTTTLSVEQVAAYLADEACAGTHGSAGP